MVKILSLAVISITISVAVSDNYNVYEPQSAEYRVQDMLRDPTLLYNDHPSIEYFEQEFVAVWQASGENNPDVPGRRLYLSTTKNFINWTKPIDFLVKQAINPFVPSVIAEEQQSNPVLFNYNDTALWCIWAIEGLNTEKTNAGVYISVLQAGSKLWSTTRIFENFEHGGKKFYATPTQKPIQCKSGKIILPIRLHEARIEGKRPFSVQAFLFSNDGGRKWEFADDTISLPEDATIQLNTAIHQQNDGKIRVFSVPDYRNNLPAGYRLLTTEAIGSELENKLKFDIDLRPAGMETTGGSVATLQLSNGRYAMVLADVYSEINGENMYYNAAVFFSRSGGNDFVGAYPFAKGKAISNPQLLENDGKLYIIYSQGLGTQEPSSSIMLNWVELPEQEKNYIYPRSKDIISSYDVSYQRNKIGGQMRRIRSYNQIEPLKDEIDNRNALVFQASSAAGLDVDYVDTENDESITIDLDLKVINLQLTGELTLFSVGDLFAAKIVMPSARPGELYICAPGKYEKICDLKPQQWFSLSVKYTKDNISFTIDDNEPIEVDSELISQRFYIANNCQIDTALTNEGSVFCVDIDSISSQTNKKASFTEY